MDVPKATAAAAEGSAELVGANLAASADAGERKCSIEAPSSSQNGLCSNAKGLDPIDLSPSDFAFHPDSSQNVSRTPICVEGCEDAPREEAEQILPTGIGLEQKPGEIKQIVEKAISIESRQAVMKILDMVNQLSMVEKLYLYLKLPTGKSAPVDPLRQPLNPLGSRFEIQQTITWIKTHLEEDPDVSLPKQDVYNEYQEYCSHNKMKPLSNADFGKVMKQVFPCVRPRRLGTRGNSRYCYSGMRKRIKLQPPLLPDLAEHKSSPSQAEDEILTAASYLIREWAEKLLSVKFDSLKDLACHLVEKMCVDSRSVAAFTLLSVAAGKYNGKDSTSPLGFPAPGGNNKRVEAQMQLQRKLKEREMIREQKRKLQDQQQQAAALAKGAAFEKLKPSKRAKLENVKGHRIASTFASLPGNSTSVNSSTAIASSATSWEAEITEDKILSKPGTLGRRGKSASVDSIVTTNDSIQLRQVMTASVPVISSVFSSGKKVNPDDVFFPVQPSTQNDVSQPSCSQIPEKLPIPRIINYSSRCSKASVVPQQKICLALHKKFYKPIQPKPENLEVKSKEAVRTQEKTLKEYISKDVENHDPCPTSAVKLEGKLGQKSTDNRVKQENDPMSDYFHGGHNSQEQEEELMRYFQHQTSSSSNEELEDTLMPRRSVTADSTKSDQLSQLRTLLEQNLSSITTSTTVNIRQAQVPLCPMSTTLGQSMSDVPLCNDDVFLSNSVLTLPSGVSASASLSLLSHRNQQKKLQAQSQPSAVPLKSMSQKPGLLSSNNHNSSSLSVRRRVSFETSVTEHHNNENNIQNTVPPSPNTRRKYFNFTPISAGPNSPLGQRVSAPSSKPSSANVSPFVSPRNTPVHRSRQVPLFPPIQVMGQLGGRGKVSAKKVVRSNSVSSDLSANQLQPMRPRPLSTTAPFLQAPGNDSLIQINTSLQGINLFHNILESSKIRSSLLGNMQLPSSESSASLSLSAPQSPMFSSNFISTRNYATDETSEIVNSHFSLTDMASDNKSVQNCSNSSFLNDEGLNLQLPLQKSHSHLPLPTPDPLAHEVSQFFPDDFTEKSHNAVQHLQYRSQSVPLHRMISTGDLIYPHYTLPQSLSTNFQYNNFSFSAASSVAPTPVPSECMDFTNITDNSTLGHNSSLILDGADPETELNSENLDRIFNILDDAQKQQKKEEHEKHPCHDNTHQQEIHLQDMHQELVHTRDLHQQNLQLQDHQNILCHQTIQQDSSQCQSQEQQNLQKEQLQPSQSRSYTNHHHNPSLSPSTGTTTPPCYNHVHHQQSQIQLHEPPQLVHRNEVGLALELVASENVSGFLNFSGPIKSTFQSSRSYPNTPIPCKSIVMRDPTDTSFTAPLDINENNPTFNGSRSLPPTPFIPVLDEETTSFQNIVDRDPTLTLNALNSQLSDDSSNHVSRRNMNSLLVESLTLDNLDLHDCEAFSNLAGVESRVHDS